MRTCTIGGVRVGSGEPARLMGVINGSPESFYSGSYSSAASVRQVAERQVAAGAAILDLGARSTAPGSPPITAGEEAARMDALLAELDGGGFVISVDTSRPAVLETCLEHDIHMLNDIGGLADPMLAARAGEAGLAACGMASFSTPGDACGVEATLDALALVVARAEEAGIERLVLDPGVGLWTPARTVEHDWELCCAFDRFTDLGHPVLAAISRKTFLGKLTGRGPEERLAASLAVTGSLLAKGANLVRTHDVAETADLLRVRDRLEACS
ncbi:MAG: dihydropteroate synthase [Methanospirillum sp.]